MEAKTIQKYKGRSVAWLLKKTQFYFNKYIRLRDNEKPCISCDSWNTAHASHFYSAGHYSTMRFNEDNCHASCVRCNTFEHGNLLMYRIRLIRRIGAARVTKLEVLAGYDKRVNHKWNRLELIEILETYKTKCNGT